MKHKLLILILLFVCANIHADILYVKPASAGGDDNTGDGASWKTAYATPNKAFAEATASGDIIAIMQGIYAIDATLSNAAKQTNVQIQGGYTGNNDERVVNSNNTIFEYSNGGVNRVLQDYGAGLIFSGITFQNLKPAESQYGIFCQAGASLNLEDCVIKEFSNKAGSYIRGIFRFTATATLTINRCQFVNCEEKSTATNNAVITRNAGSPTLNISNSVIKGTLNCAFIAAPSTTCTITNCTFINNATGAAITLPNQTKITNSVFYNSKLVGSGTLKNSYYNTAIGGLTTSNCIEYTDATDVFADLTDFLPAATYGGIGKGDQSVVAAVGASDCIGNPRVNGKLDIGAYENQQKVTVSMNNQDVILESLGTSDAWYGEDFDFRLTPKDGYSILSVKVGTRILEPIASVYTLPSVFENTEIIVTTEIAQNEITVTTSNVTVIDPELVDGKFMTGSTASIFFTVNEGFGNPLVTVNDDDYTLDEPVGDVYSISLVDINAPKVVAIVARGKTYEVSVTTNEYIASIAGLSKEVQMKEDGTVVDNLTFTLKPGAHSPYVTINGKIVVASENAGTYSVPDFTVTSAVVISISAFAENVLPVSEDTYQRRSGEISGYYANYTYMESRGETGGWAIIPILKFVPTAAIKAAGYNKATLKLVPQSSFTVNYTIRQLPDVYESINDVGKDDYTALMNAQAVGETQEIVNVANEASSFDVTDSYVLSPMPEEIRLSVVKASNGTAHRFYSLENGNVNYIPVLVFEKDASVDTEISFEESAYEFILGTTGELKVNFSLAIIPDRRLTFESSNPAVVKIANDGKIECLALGEATITATMVADPTKKATCTVKVVEKTVFQLFAERIIADIRADKMSTAASLDVSVTSLLSQLQANGSFPDVQYSATDRTDWPPLPHLDRMILMALAYTHAESAYFESADLKTKIESALNYWQTVKPNSSNWYQNEIAEPQRMGSVLLLMEYLGKEKISSSLLTTSINRMRDKGGNPSAQTGANRVDVALHWMYRAVLTEDKNLLKDAMDYIYSPVAYTTGAEGIQYDNSYTQHGRQLHIGSYGEVFLNGVTKSALYGAGTAFALPDEQLKILSKLIKDTYIGAFRGGYIFYNAIGRASTRPGATNKVGGNGIIERMKTIDPANAQEYDNALARISESQPSSYMLSPKNTHYYKGDYTVHQRPAYSVDLRMVSTRTARNEYLKDNGEGLKQYFLSDGATGIFVDGDEYYNIYPVWNWAKIPGVTSPEFTNIPQASSYIKAGESDLVGGVSDSIYSVSVYKQIDNYTNIISPLSPAVQSSANKAWFFFDKEIVCLGNSIKSNSADYKVNTTVNQTLLKGDVSISSKGSESTLTKGAYDYNDGIDWAYHNKVAYYFPSNGKMQLSAMEQSGKWTDINTSYTQDGTVSEDVFSLSFDHGLTPDGSKYEYIILPGISGVEEARTYDPTNIEILENTASLQVVYHKGLKMYGMVFYEGATFERDGLIVDADAPCVLMLKDVDKAATILHVADPQNASRSINIGIKTPALSENKGITYQATNPYLGQSLKFVVDETTPAYAGKSMVYDRSDWTIIASSEGPVDNAVAPAGDRPEYIIDGDTQTAFLFVKPSKTLGNVTVPADAEVSFTIDMKAPKDIAFFIYRHRTYNNTQASLRASKVSFYGKNAEGDDFTPIIQDQAIATDVAEVQVELPQQVNYRYVKLEMTEWDKTTSNTIQVSEFYIGYLEGMPTSDEVVKSKENSMQLSLYPNPVKKGELLSLNTTASLDIEVFDLSGKICFKTQEPTVDTKQLSKGMYILRATDTKTGTRASANFIVF